MGLEVERTVVSGQTPEHWTVLLAGSGEEGVEGFEEGEAGREYEEVERKMSGHPPVHRSAHG